MSESIALIMVIGWVVCSIWAHAEAVGGWKALFGAPSSYRVGWQRTWPPIAYASLFAAAAAVSVPNEGDTLIIKAARGVFLGLAVLPFTVAFVAIRIRSARWWQDLDKRNHQSSRAAIAQTEQAPQPDAPETGAQ